MQRIKPKQSPVSLTQSATEVKQVQQVATVQLNPTYGGPNTLAEVTTEISRSIHELKRREVELSQEIELLTGQLDSKRMELERVHKRQEALSTASLMVEETVKRALKTAELI